MRELKSRAWDRVFERWVYINLPKGDISWGDYEWSQDDLEEWQQYTGLKDKNGVEIYEGDIVLIIASPVVTSMGDASAGYIAPGLTEPPKPYVEKATPPRLLVAEVRVSPVKGTQLLVRKAQWGEDQKLLELFNEPFSDAKYSDNWSIDELEDDERINNYVGMRLSFRKKDIVEVIGNIYKNPELLEKA